jgi:hypothetical protein
MDDTTLNIGEIDMKTKTRAVAIGALLCTTMMAQPRFGEFGSPAVTDPATVVANQVARLTKLLTLTTAQAAQATTIFTNALSAVTPLKTSLSTDRTALKTAIQGNATTTIDTLSATIGSLTGQITAIQSKADAAFYASLTAAQQTILNASGGGLGDPGGHGGPHR